MTEIGDRGQHLEGRPVSSSTYTNYGCRCDWCRAAATEYVRNARKKHGGPFASQRIRHRAEARAATYVRQHHPDVWLQLLHEARRDLGG